jgi:predicted amidohydrolase
MQDLKVALVQANQVWENKQENLNHFSKIIENLGAVDLILLPEMFHTGFSMHAQLLAEDVESSLGITWLRETAKKHSAAVYTSLIIKENERFYNRGVFVFPTGELKTYDKRKSFGLAGEDEIYTAGEKESIVRYKEWNFQLQICYDLRFPEIVRNRILPEGIPAYDVILYVANWPEKRKEHWITLLKARAIENQAYVLGVNRVGSDDNGQVYSGNSVAIDALGNSVMCEENKEEILFYTLRKEPHLSVLQSLPFLKDR